MYYTTKKIPAYGVIESKKNGLTVVKKIISALVTDIDTTEEATEKFGADLAGHVILLSDGKTCITSAWRGKRVIETYEEDPTGTFLLKCVKEV